VYRLTKGDVTAVALADGMGSCRSSHLGAQIAVQSACRALSAEFNSLLNLSPAEARDAIFNSVYGALRNYSRRTRIALKYLSSTLLAVVSDGKKFIAVHMGDGAIVAVSDNGSHVISKPMNGRFANETWCMTKRVNKRMFRIIGGELPSGSRGFVLFSDGSAESLVWGEQAHEACAVMVKSLEQTTSRKASEELETFLHQKIRTLTTDDCSAAVLSLHCSPLEEIEESLPEMPIQAASSAPEKVPAAFMEKTITRIPLLSVPMTEGAEKESQEHKEGQSENKKPKGTQWASKTTFFPPDSWVQSRVRRKPGRFRMRQHIVVCKKAIFSSEIAAVESMRVERG